MALLSSAAPKHVKNPRIVPDLRRHRRVPLKLAGRFMREDRQEYPCELQDISVGGAGIITPVSVTMNERLVAYFDHIGGLEAVVTRVYRDGFAVQFKISAHKREKLAAQITWLINREEFPEEAGRMHERIGAGGRKVRLKTPDDLVIDVDVLDVSISGASIATGSRLPVGAQVILANFPAVVRRHHEQGMGLQFAEPHDINVLRQSLL